MYDEDDYADIGRNRPWVRGMALFVAVALLLGTGIYYLSTFLASGSPIDSSSWTSDDPADMPANAITCAGSTDVDPVPDDLSLDDQIVAIQDRVEQLRYLKFKEDIKTEFLSNDELADEIRDTTLEDYPPEDIDRDERILTTFGLIPDEMGLVDVLDDLASQVAGFYEPDTGRLVVGSNLEGEGLSPLDELTLAHEVEHAVADQNHGLPIDEDPEGSELDAVLARRSLIEGDATLLQRHYASAAMTSDDMAEMFDDPTTQDALEDAEDIPYPILRSFEFPYVEGLAFVCDLYSQGGWRAVDRAYDRPPTTTAQILFPHRYRTGEDAVEAPAPGTLRAPWEEIDDSALGAADLLLLFEAPGGDPSRSLTDPMGRASHWAGGTMTTYASNNATAVGLTLVQRDSNDELCESMYAWYLKAFPDSTRSAMRPGETMALKGDERSAVMSCPGDTVRMGIAPDIEVARTLIH